MVISIGNASPAFTGNGFTPTVTRSRCGVATYRRPAEATGRISRRAPCRGRDPRQSEDLIDSWLRPRASSGGIALVVPGCHRGAACDRAHRSRRLRAAPADRRAVQAIIAGNDRATLDPESTSKFMFYPTRALGDGPRLDLAAQHHARHRPRHGAGQGKAAQAARVEQAACPPLPSDDAD
jgi:hypothetical protein